MDRKCHKPLSGIRSGGAIELREHRVSGFEFCAVKVEKCVRVQFRRGYPGRSVQMGNGQAAVVQSKQAGAGGTDPSGQHTDRVGDRRVQSTQWRPNKLIQQADERHLV